ERVSGAAALAHLRTLIERNLTSIEFWRHHCNINPADFPPLDGAFRTLENAHIRLVGLIERKSGALLEPIRDAPELREAEREVADVATAVGAYNTVVGAANEAIAILKAATAAGDLTAAQGELSRLEAVRRRHETEVARACVDYVELDRQKRELERQKTEVRRQ